MQNESKTKTLSSLLVLTALFSGSVGHSADVSYSGRNKAVQPKVDVTIIPSRESLLSQLRGNGRGPSDGSPNSSALLEDIRKSCESSTRTLGLARQAAEEAAYESLTTPGPILAEGISDALKDVNHVGKVNFHYVVALRAADKIAKSFMRSTQEEIESVGSDLTGKNRYVFLSELADTVIKANLELDIRYLFPFYSSCGMNTPIVIIPGQPVPLPQHPSAIPQQAVVAQHMHQHPGNWVPPGYYNPGYCGVNPEYYFGVGKLAQKIMELSSKNGRHPSYSKVEIQLELARSIIGATIDVLLYSDLNRYYQGVISALDVLDARVEKMLKPGGMAETNPSRAVAITFHEFDAIKSQLSHMVNR